MKSKRWKRRNRHTRPEWVLGWSYAEEHTRCYGGWHIAACRDNQVVVLDNDGYIWSWYTVY